MKKTCNKCGRSFPETTRHWKVRLGRWVPTCKYCLRSGRRVDGSMKKQMYNRQVMIYNRLVAPRQCSNCGRFWEASKFHKLDSCICSYCTSAQKQGLSWRDALIPSQVDVYYRLIQIKTCSRCYRTLPYAMFSNAVGHSTGKHSTCDECMGFTGEKRRSMALYAEGKRRCNSCGVVYELTSEFFYRTKSRVGGFRYKCKSCLNERRSKDPVYRLRRCVWNWLRRNDRRFIKSDSTAQLLGNSLLSVVEYIEQQFTSEMSWDNYGELWHIDHVVPCAMFNLHDEAEQKMCFHYTNLQPMIASDNMAKGAKVSKELGNYDAAVALLGADRVQMYVGGS